MQRTSMVLLLGLVHCASVSCAPTALAQLPLDKSTKGVSEESPDLLPTRSFTLLSQVLSKTDKVATFHFEKPCFECRVLSLTAQDVLTRIQPKLLDRDQTVVAKKLLSDQGSYILALAKSCPSISATDGFVLYQPDSIAVLLLYSNCKTARLVLESGGTSYFFNLDPVYSELAALSSPHD